MLAGTQVDDLDTLQLAHLVKYLAFHADLSVTIDIKLSKHIHPLVTYSLQNTGV